MTDTAAHPLQPAIRRATLDDLPEVVRLFSLPDEGNTKREDPGPPLPACYAEALERIADDPHNALLVADLEGRIVGAFHLTIIQYVAYMGGRVAMIENVIVEPELRSRGVGEVMMRWAIDEARRRGCFRVQLTTNKVRKRAHQFYERLGFTKSHEGMKLSL
ncbi:GNAT family N-acetyltransferase [Chondromyces apiculatus]|uniref:GCN5-related N-acetyltransferase n=1 Tax=Chondromyces apiculatus DSM 436 TaxID=1192034 RepID=A0A017TAP5_9BACT|nr:GNAT family N-acetyltransferase [Chondromyces apiculatus]EYF05676.1 GCN5-related N-acetyltransferase [Chondromyces apiculatus DSM 436]